MFLATVAVLLGSAFFLLLLLYLRYASPFAHWAVLSHSSARLLSHWLSSPPLSSLPPSCLGSSSPSRLPSWCYVLRVLGVSLPPPPSLSLSLSLSLSSSSSLLGVGCPSSSSVYLPPLAPSSLLTSPSPCFDLVSFPSLLSPRLPPLVSFFLLGFRLIPGWGVGSTLAFWGVSLYPPIPIRECRFRLFCTDTCCLLPPPTSTHPSAWVTAYSSLCHLVSGPSAFLHHLLLGFPFPSFRLWRCSPLFLR